MIRNGFSYAACEDISSCGGRQHHEPHPFSSRLGPSKNHEVPRNGFHAFFRLCLELSLDVHYIGVVRCTRLRICHIIRFQIPTPFVRYWTYDKMSVVTFSGFVWHKSFPPLYKTHSRGILKVQEFRTVR